MSAPVGSLRDCAVCGAPVPARPYQARSARTCGPTCAKTLALREQPDLEPNSRVRAMEPKEPTDHE